MCERERERNEDKRRGCGGCVCDLHSPSALLCMPATSVMMMMMMMDLGPFDESIDSIAQLLQCDDRRRYWPARRPSFIAVININILYLLSSISPFPLKDLGGCNWKR